MRKFISIQVAMLLTSVIVLSAGACKDDDINSTSTTSFGLLNGEPWKAQSSISAQTVCESYLLGFSVYENDGSLTQSLLLYFYDIQSVGTYDIYETSYNDQGNPNCSRWPDTVTTLLATLDDDFVTAFYTLSSELGACTLQIDSINDQRTYFAGTINARFVNPGYDTRIYRGQLPDTVAFTNLVFGAHVNPDGP